MRKIAVVTVARSDYGILRPVLAELVKTAGVELQLVVAGMHLAQEFGSTVSEIEADGYEIAARVPTVSGSDSPVGIARSIAAGVIGFAEAFERLDPDLVVVLGDRYEMLAAAVAALPLTVPVAHLHGGESTEGLIDEGIRHSITKLSHVHFAATELYAQRLQQMGEEPWRIHQVGAPGIDAIRSLEPLSDDELDEALGFRFGDARLLVTYHPVTLEPRQVEARLGALLDALDASAFDILFTAPNADTRNRVVAQRIDEYVASRPQAELVASLGSRGYLTVLGRARAMVGNSSSGIIEAASFELPVVNVGMRQQGRLRARNVIDVGDSAAEILQGIRVASSDEFCAGLVGLENPYGDGHAAPRIAEVLAEISLDDKLLIKRFHDLPGASG